MALQEDEAFIAPRREIGDVKMTVPDSHADIRIRGEGGQVF